MKYHEPVPLWKGIVGTAFSGVVLLILGPICIVFSLKEDTPLWFTITLFVCVVVCFISLAISLYNISSTVRYRATRRIEQKRAQTNDNLPQIDKFDEIRKYKELLDEGIISQEEFDKKKKELLG